MDQGRTPDGLELGHHETRNERLRYPQRMDAGRDVALAAIASSSSARSGLRGTPRLSKVAGKGQESGEVVAAMLKLLAHCRPAALIGALALAGCASSQNRFQQQAA